MNNNALLEEDGKLVPYVGACGRVVELGRHGDIRLNENTFRGKPYNAISISVWVNLHHSSRGSHSVFSTAHAPRRYTNVQGELAIFVTGSLAGVKPGGPLTCFNDGWFRPRLVF